MMLMLLMTMILMMIMMILMMINFMLSPMKKMMREKLSPFECGFDPFNSSRLPFSIHQFYTISLIFLIFDIEIIIFFPFIPSYLYYSIETNITMAFLFLIILLMGLYLEWNDGALKWLK